MQFSELLSRHGDIVHDISFDYYGKRFCSCSSDKSIKVWDMDDVSGEWVSFDIPRAHQDSIWKLSWAHPEFGQIFASCSEDKNVHIWEEQESVNGVDVQSRGRWLKKTQLTDSKKSVNDVKFAPRHLGLKLASASGDGIVRIYEANDVFSLNYWPMQDSFQVETSPEHASEHGVTCLSWSDCPFENPKLAIGGYSKVPSIWECVDNRWQLECLLEPHGDVVHDIAWAPSMGRSYHLIATASREKSFKIHSLSRNEGKLSYTNGSCQTIMCHSEIWRVAWNITGTVLITSAEDGSLACWRKDFSGEWVNVQNLPFPANENSDVMYKI